MAKNTWGGRRPGSGRRPKGDVPGVSHHPRELISHRQAILVTLRTKKQLGSLRKRRIHRVIRDCLIEGCDAGQFRVCHYALERHGMRMIVEADDNRALSLGMQGLNVRIAKSLNRLWHRNGSVFADRYETSVLRTGKHMRKALCQVLCAARADRTEAKKLSGRPDPYSSALYFDGWKDLRPGEYRAPAGLSPVVRPQTTLLKRTWRRYGLLGLDEEPI